MHVLVRAALRHRERTGALERASPIHTHGHFDTIRVMAWRKVAEPVPDSMRAFARRAKLLLDENINQAPGLIEVLRDHGWNARSIDDAQLGALDRHHLIR